MCFSNCRWERYPHGWHEDCRCVKPKGWPCPQDVDDEEAERLNDEYDEYEPDEDQVWGKRGEYQ